MNYARVAIVIVNWNGKHFLEECLMALRQQTYKNHSIYFVDNGSTDESVDFVKQRFPEAVVIELDHNTGFAKGNNIGIREALKDAGVYYIATLNNDTKAEPSWLEELVTTADSDPSVGSVASLMYLPNGCIHNLGNVVRKSGFGYGIDVFLPTTSHTENFFITATCAGAALYRREALERVGLFDEDFFAYYEDTDLSLRMLWAGYKNICAVRARVLHYHSGTTRSFSLFKLYYSERNKIFMVVKNFPVRSIILAPIYAFFDYPRIYRQSKKDAGGNSVSEGWCKIVKTVFRAYCDALKLISSKWIERKMIFADKEISTRRFIQYLT